MSGYHNLDNEEVVFVYLTNKKFIDQYETILKDGGVESVVDLSETTYVINFKQFTQEDLIEMQNDLHYRYCQSVDRKLEPIVEIIREELPDLYDKVYKLFNSL